MLFAERIRTNLHPRKLATTRSWSSTCSSQSHLNQLNLYLRSLSTLIVHLNFDIDRLAGCVTGHRKPRYQMQRFGIAAAAAQEKRMKGFRNFLERWHLQFEHVNCLEQGRADPVGS